MSDDKKKGIKGSKKIGGVDPAKEAERIRKAQEVSEVKEVKKTSGVGAVKGAGKVRARQATRVMTAKEKDALFQMIEEEADKMFGDSNMSPERREVIENAVKMAVDAGIIDEEE